eukprot:TRINITY_DN21048_c0_g1_i1.p1 TRINITY_DN21048_c0_g1~~TRINITY_DN21048_c0_g1_i1.p1  ORF type:complete len:204 (-),score=39.93 TRINITY_DN21048_c0_g1_i1:509-1120(-)
MNRLRSAILSSGLSVKRFCRLQSCPTLRPESQAWTFFRGQVSLLHHAVPSSPPSSSLQEERSPPSEKINRLLDEITELTILEVSDLTKLLRKRLGLPDIGGGMPMMGMMMGQGVQQGSGPAPAAAAEAKKEEKTVFDVTLEKFDAASKLKIIKEVRALTSLGLKEAKELVEKSPVVVKAGVTKEEAETIVEKLKAVGATCALE